MPGRCRTMHELIANLVQQNRSGAPVSVPSVCTSHPGVLTACLDLAARRELAIIVEATSNQVNQFGGYTGQTPDQFADQVSRLAEKAEISRHQLVLGGDHLGPQCWRQMPANEAMARAHQLVADYVRAGFTKIHLDCSMGCADDSEPLSDEQVAERSAVLAISCLDAADDPDLLCFVIGTEVPPPGGVVLLEDGAIPATTPAAVTETLAAHRAAFDAAGISQVINQTVGLVVQPGVEFAAMSVSHFPAERELAYRSVLDAWPALCLEAHSTDYQKRAVFPALAGAGFAFQKVGPALTFAWRQAIYALDHIRAALESSVPRLQMVMEQLMLADNSSWHAHYGGDQEAQFIGRHFGLADRIRYYWPRPEAQQEINALLGQLAARELPAPLLNQFFADAIIEQARRWPGGLVDGLITAQVQAALEPYLQCPPTRITEPQI